MNTLALFDAAQLGGQVHAYFIHLDDAAPDLSRVDPAKLAILSQREQERYRRFYFDKDKYLYLVAHYALRQVLAHYLSCPPEDIDFESNEYGRPEVSQPQTSLRFNLTHTQGLIGIVLTHKIDCGIDVESSHKDRKTLELVNHVFAPQEISAFEQLQGQAQDRRFYQYWTLKEAFIKARGMGLSLALDSFYFDIDTSNNINTESSQISIGFNQSFGEQPNDWFFKQGEFAEQGKQWALAIKAAGNELALKRQSFNADDRLFRLFI